MFAVRSGAIVFVYVGNQVVDEAVAKTETSLRIPVAVIGEDHDEGHGLIGMDQLICDCGRAEAYPLILVVGLAVK